MEIDTKIHDLTMKIEDTFKFPKPKNFAANKNKEIFILH